MAPVVSKDSYLRTTYNEYESKNDRRKTVEENASETLGDGAGCGAANLVSFDVEVDVINEAVRVTKDTHH